MRTPHSFVFPFFTRKRWVGRWVNGKNGKVNPCTLYFFRATFCSTVAFETQLLSDQWRAKKRRSPRPRSELFQGKSLHVIILALERDLVIISHSSKLIDKK